MTLRGLLTRALDTARLTLYSTAQLDALTARHYASSDYRTDRHNEGGLYPWTQEALTHFPRRGRLLETSAGGGRETLALVAAGFEVVATECVPTLADGLRRRTLGLAVEVHQLPPDAVPPGPFDGAVVGWGAYTHTAGRARRVDFLRRIAAELRPGAPVLVTFWSTPRHSPGARAVAALATLLRRPFGGRVVEAGESTSQELFTRTFVPGEVADEARAAGLVDAIETQPPDPYLVAFKKR